MNVVLRTALQLAVQSCNAAYLFKQDWFWNPIVSFLGNFPRQANEYAIFHLPKQDLRRSHVAPLA